MEAHGPAEGDPPAQRPIRPAGSQDAAAAGKPRALDATLEPYVREAIASQEVNQQAVAEAIKLLESGQLDTPEAIARAAESILFRGI